MESVYGLELSLLNGWFTCCFISSYALTSSSFVATIFNFDDLWLLQMVHEVDFVLIPKPFVTTRVVKMKSRLGDMFDKSDGLGAKVDLKVKQADQMMLQLLESGAPLTAFYTRRIHPNIPQLYSTVHAVYRIVEVTTKPVFHFFFDEDFLDEDYHTQKICPTQHPTPEIHPTQA